MKLNSILFFLFFSVFSYAQKPKTKSQLQKEKKENLLKIKEAQETLQKTSAQKEVSRGHLNTYKYQINAQSEIINNYKDEIDISINEIEQNQQIINSLRKDVDELKEEYSRMIYSASKATKGKNNLTLLFSSNSFNQLFRRLHYLKQYTNTRKKQVEQINAVKKMLLQQISFVEIKKKEQLILFKSQLVEKNKLIELKSREYAAITFLRSREKKIKLEIKRRNKSLVILNKKIDDIIKKEIALAKSKASLLSTKKLTSDFAKNKTKLPWPANGFISQKFGISRDPILKGVEHNNPGVEIQTKPNTVIKCISQGSVSSIFTIQGFNKGVLIKHGNYYSVYAKLKDIKVKKGQILNTGDSIGTVYTSNDGVAELHFEIWESFSKLNPEVWLKKK